jgi:hypothetical protein
MSSSGILRRANLKISNVFTADTSSKPDNSGLPVTVKKLIYDVPVGAWKIPVGQR